MAYSGPGPGEMGASPGVSFGGPDPSDPGGDEAVAIFAEALAALSDQPRYSGAPSLIGHIDDQGYHQFSQPLDASKSWMSATRGMKDTRNPLGMLMGLLSPIPGAGLIGQLAKYGPEAASWNIAQMMQEEPHHNEEGTWTADSFFGAMDPRDWHPGPIQSGSPDTPGGDSPSQSPEGPAPPGPDTGVESEILMAIIRQILQNAQATQAGGLRGSPLGDSNPL